MIVLERLDSDWNALESFDGFCRGLRSSQSRHHGDFGVECCGANFDFIFTSFLTGGGVDDELDIAVFEHVEDVGAAFGKFEDLLAWDMGLL